MEIILSLYLIHEVSNVITLKCYQWLNKFKTFGKQMNWNYFEKEYLTDVKNVALPMHLHPVAPRSHAQMVMAVPECSAVTRAPCF